MYVVHPVKYICSQRGGVKIKNLWGVKLIKYRKSKYIQDPPMQKMKVLAQLSALFTLYDNSPRLPFCSN